MGYIEYVTGVTPDAATADDVYKKVEGTRDGAIWTADWVLARSQEGRVFIANAGTVTTPITFGAGTIDNTEFDLFLSVPSGTTVGILSVECFLEVVGTSAILEGMAISGTGGVTGAGTAITPRSVRTDAPVTSNCTITAAATLTSATAITGNEFFRFGYNKIVTVLTAGASGGTLDRKFSWNHKAAGYMPILVGAAQLGVFCASQAGQGFITVVYVEIPSTRIT